MRMMLPRQPEQLVVGAGVIVDVLVAIAAAAPLLIILLACCLRLDAKLKE